MGIDLFSFKELYDVYLKLTYPLEIGERNMDEGEVIAKFDKIQMAALQENKSIATSSGGFDNRDRIFWETTKSVSISFSQGVFSKTHFALLSNSKILNVDNTKKIIVSKTEFKETDDQGNIVLEEAPASRQTFVYDVITGERITIISTEGKKVHTPKAFLQVIVEYQYMYDGGGQVMKIGQRLVSGFLELEGKTRIKDDTTGQVVTGLIKIPKLRLMSDLSIRMGSNANPVAANFSAEGIPVGERGESYVSEFFFLNNDISSDL